MDYFDCSSPICNEIENDTANNDEDFLKAKKEITHTILNIDLGAYWFHNTVNLNQSYFLRFKKVIFECLDKYQKKNMALKELLKKLKHKKAVLQDQLEDKEDELERLKTKFISQGEEQEEPRKIQNNLNK